MEQIDPQYRESLVNQVRALEMAEKFKASELGAWFQGVILGTLHDEAVELLSRSKTETDRVMAQQTLLASRKPMSLVDRLITDGRAAIETLKQISDISTPKEGENNA